METIYESIEYNFKYIQWNKSLTYHFFLSKTMNKDLVILRINIDHNDPFGLYEFIVFIMNRKEIKIQCPNFC